MCLYITNSTHWGWVMHICVGNPTIIGSDNGLSSPGWSQEIIYTNAGILLIGPLGTNFSEILIKILTFSFNKMHLKMLSAEWRPFCLSLNVLRSQLHLSGTMSSRKQTQRGHEVNLLNHLQAVTHWGQDKMAAIFQTTFSNAFSWMKMFKFWLRFHWSLFPRVQLTIFQHWFR